MKRKIYKWSLIVIGVFALTLVGCGSAKRDSNANVTPTPTATITSEPTAIPTPKPTSSEDPTPKDIPQTTSEDIQGEGMTDGTIPDLAQIPVAQVGTPIVFTAESGFDLFVLTINSIATTTSDLQASIPEGNKVVLVHYDYENISSSDPLLFDDMSFKLVVDNIACTPLFSADLTTAEIAEIDGSSVGQIAFLVDQDTKEVTLIFENSMTDTQALFTTTIE